MDERDLAKVEAAFQTLLEVVGRECDAETAWTVECARVDVLAILSGEWSDVAMRKRCGGGAVPVEDEDELLQAVLAARSVEEFDAAALLLLLAGTFDDLEDVQAARGGIAANWRPSAMGNEVMLTALETYGEKRAGALGRGASRTQAEVFALVEARRVFWQLAS